MDLRLPRLEGTEVCRWLNGLGVTAALLKYRVPARKDSPRHLSPQMDAQRAFLEDLAARRYESPALDARDCGAALDLDSRYADLKLGLADLSVVVPARKVRTRRLLTFDQPHFRAVRPLQGGSFTLLPADR